MGMARPSSSPRTVGAGFPVASSQDCDQARAATHPFSPKLDKLLILTGNDLGQIEGGGNPGERRSGSSLGEENPWQVTACLQWWAIPDPLEKGAARALGEQNKKSVI